MAKRKSKSTSKGTHPVFLSVLLTVLSLLFVGREELLITLQNFLNERENPAITVTEDGELFYHVIDVGQGDCTIIQTAEKTVLIDAGENGKGYEVVKYLDDIGVEYIDYIIVTHTHSDHMGGVDEVMEEFAVGEVLIPKIPSELIPTTKTFTDFLDTVESQNVTLNSVTDVTLELDGGATIEVFMPNIVPDNVNDTSLYTFTSCGEVDFFSSGDAEADSEHSILAHRGISSTEVMKAGHHGSDTSNTKELLAVIRPNAVFITVGFDNSYSHPHGEVLDRIARYTDIVTRTDLDGSFHYYTDGKTITLNAGGEQVAIPVK